MLLLCTNAQVPPPEDSCTGNEDCTKCTNTSSCVWCNSVLWGAICLEGDFWGPENSYQQLSTNASLCKQYYQNQCTFDGAWLFGTNYLWQVIGGVIVFIVVALLCICGIPLCIKRCMNKKSRSSGCGCGCGVSEGDVVRAPVRRDPMISSNKTSGNVSGGGGGGRTGGSGGNDAPTIAKLAQSGPVKKQAPVKLINLEDLDKTRLPPGFPAEPPKPVYTGSIPPAGKQEEESYKEYMRSRLAYEQWENSLLLWHRRNAASANPVVW